MVPLLVALARLDQRRASALSLAAIVPASLVGAVGYFLRGEVDVPAAVALAAGALPGTLIGTRLLKVLPLGVLRWLFVALLVLVAVRMLVEEPSRGGDVPLDAGVLALLVVAGLATGIASGLLGVGGGVIMVPVLIAGAGVGDLLAKGTSLAVILTSSLLGTGTNLRAGLVRLRPALLVGGPAALASYPGVAAAFLLPARASAIAFAVLLLLTALQLTLRALRKGPDTRRSAA